MGLLEFSFPNEVVMLPKPCWHPSLPHRVLPCDEVTEAYRLRDGACFQTAADSAVWFGGGFTALARLRLFLGGPPFRYSFDVLLMTGVLQEFHPQLHVWTCRCFPTTFASLEF